MMVETFSGTMISVFEYDKSGAILNETHENFGIFPDACELDTSAIRFEKFKKWLNEAIIMQCASDKNHVYLGDCSYYSTYNTKILTFLNNLCKIRHYSYDKSQCTLNWKKK